MAEQPQTEIFSVPRCRTTLVTNTILISLFLNTVIVISSIALPNYGPLALWFNTSTAVLTYIHHFAVLYLDRKYRHTPKKSPVVSTLWCIIILFLIGASWLVAITFDLLFGLKYFQRPAVQAFGYVVGFLSTLVEAGLIFFLGCTCISERKHAQPEYEGA
ncbi:uncharacterized protein EV420DRAFT_1186010 [Desarmillaria tabescens]|uniref:Uncharacterized protein n=1 Tax=Armillaria tabescens TaxID=1929756 RepID=A0AA39TSL9_ARMTA|nr:uncharacterized protein EV420DRAFT_1186010 [Desarmillaria tabescens]KAK0462419.1 hypothetical protein EV420DRAFT_1186010 [Desarmillaria tabescens]